MIKQRVAFLGIVAVTVATAIVCKATETRQEMQIEEVNTDTVPVEVEVKEVEVVEQESTEETVYRISLNKEERELLYRTVYCESGNQSIEAQEMVALTILNRLESDKFPDTLHDVIYQKNQYEVTEWYGFETYGWTEQVEQAVENALIENMHPSDMYYFRNGYYHGFGVPYMQSGDLYFSTEGR